MSSGRQRLRSDVELTSDAGVGDPGGEKDEGREYRLRNETPFRVFVASRQSRGSDSPRQPGGEPFALQLSAWGERVVREDMRDKLNLEPWTSRCIVTENAEEDEVDLLSVALKRFVLILFGAAFYAVIVWGLWATTSTGCDRCPDRPDRHFPFGNGSMRLSPKPFSAEKGFARQLPVVADRLPQPIRSIVRDALAPGARGRKRRRGRSDETPLPWQRRRPGAGGRPSRDIGERGHLQGLRPEAMRRRICGTG